jgi:hypothetical protein
MKKLLALPLLVFFTLSLIAREPVTLVRFYDNYMSDQNVQNSEKFGTLDGNAARYLMDQNVGIEYKAAVINALIDSENKNNASTLAMHLGRKYGKPFDQLDYGQLNGHELFALGYLKIIDKDGDPTEGLPLLEKAKQLLPNSYTVNIIYALAKAEELIKKGDECEAWQTAEAVKNNFTLTKDLSPATAEAIIAEVEPYKTACN